MKVSVGENKSEDRDAGEESLGGGKKGTFWRGKKPNGVPRRELEDSWVFWGGTLIRFRCSSWRGSGIRGEKTQRVTLRGYKIAGLFNVGGMEGGGKEAGGSYEGLLEGENKARGKPLKSGGEKGPFFQWGSAFAGAP